MSRLTALDLLFLPPVEQTILACLTRTPRQSLGALAQATDLPIAKLKEEIARLVSQQSVVKEHMNGQTVFSAPVELTRSQIRNSPLDTLTFFS